jgi:hypothetical protein
MVPIPRFHSWEALHTYLAEQCRKRRERRLRGHTEIIAERFKRDRAAMLKLPAATYEACDKTTARVSSLSLVRYRSNDYSVPTQYGHRQVLVKGYVHQVSIACGSEVIARHERSYERLLEARLKKHGEYVQVLRLMETFAIEEVTRAINDALRLSTISFDAVRHLLLCRMECRPPRLDMENYPHLPLA